MNKTCFVIMPIGEMTLNDGTKIAAGALRDRYSELIRQALMTARPHLDVTRADDVPASGAITTDIFTRLMFSDVVVADITYPNPNVFYELGLRHACRAGTVLIRDIAGQPLPFDISALRHIPYENTPGGLKKLSGELDKALGWLEQSPAEPDNEFQKLAKLLKFGFPRYEPSPASLEDVFVDLFANPQILQMAVTAQVTGQDIDQSQLIQVMASEPDSLKQLMRALLSSGQIKLN